jgi:hypothetical protein
MNNTVMELGAYDIDNHPEESFDLIWIVPPRRDHRLSSRRCALAWNY